MKALRLFAESIDPSLSENRRSKDANETWKNPRIELTELIRPTPKDDELLIKIEYCGLCGSDFHLAERSKNGGRIIYPGLTSLPVTIGHEFSGTIIDYGKHVSEQSRKQFPIGSSITAEEMQWCGECHQCRAGNPNHCEYLEEIGFTIDGAHAEFICVKPKYCWNLWPLEEKNSRDEALKMGAVVEPYAVAFRALFQGAQKGQWLPGNKILIFGAGPIGLAALDLGLISGATEAHVVESMASRREFAKTFGATKCFESHTHVSETYDWIIDAAGASESVMYLADHNLKIGGTICLIARDASPGLIRAETFITKNARVFGSQGHSGENTFPRIIELMAKEKLKVKLLTREVINMKEALDRLIHQRKCAGKVLVKPSQE